MTMLRSRSSIRSVVLSLFAVALATCAMFGDAQVANAGTIILYSVNETDWTALSSSPTPQTVGTGTSQFVVTNAGVQQLNGGPAGTWLLSSALSVTSLGTNTPGSKLYLAFGADLYTTPPLPMTETTSLTTLVSINSSATIQSMVNNTLAFAGNGQPNPPTWLTGGILVGPTSSSASALVTGGITYPFVINQEVIITMNPNGVYDFLGATTLAAVPEPASMTLLGIGLVGMAGYGWRKRRQQSTQTVA